LVNNVHSFRKPISEAGHGAVRAFQAGARPDFALIADRAAPRREGPAKVALFAKAAVPTGAPPPGFGLVADVRTFTARAWPKRALYLAIAAALTLHLAVLTPFLVRPPALAPLLEKPDRELGMEDGKREQLSVAVISEADLKRLSSDPFRQEARPAPEETETPPQEAPPPEPPSPAQEAVKEASASFSPTESKSDQKREVPFDTAGYIAAASEQFGFQLKQAVHASEARQEQQARPVPKQLGNVKSFRPGATHQGQSDEWERKVIWALAATKPMGNGQWGTTLVTFVVSESGQVQGLRLVKSSGDNWLDQGALMGVRQARIPAPPAGLPLGDRAFNIEYISLPNGVR
jgi:protein TonB